MFDSKFGEKFMANGALWFALVATIFVRIMAHFQKTHWTMLLIISLFICYNSKIHTSPSTNLGCHVKSKQIIIDDSFFCSEIKPIFLVQFRCYLVLLFLSTTNLTPHVFRQFIWVMSGTCSSWTIFAKILYSTTEEDIVAKNQI